MNINTFNIPKRLLKFGLIGCMSTTLITACEFDRDDSDLITGSLSIAITDAPIDDLAAVFLSFKGLSVFTASGEETEILFDEPKLIDMLTLQNGVSTDLITEHTLKAGSYKYAAFNIDFNESYVVTDAANGSENISLMVSNHRGPVSVLLDLFLRDPNADLPTASFEISQDSNTALTFDLDLRKSIFQEDGMSHLSFSPSIRSVITDEAGEITGSIPLSQFTLDNDCQNLGSSEGAAVYIFSGNNATPKDIRGNLSDPFSIASVTNSRDYTLAFLPAGEYTIALTCESHLDTVDNKETLNFLEEQNITVSAGVSSEYNFPENI